MKAVKKMFPMAKPEKQLKELLDALIPAAEQLPTGHRQSLHFSINETHYCYLMETGHITINRIDDDLLLYSESAPFIFGFTTMIHHSTCQLLLKTSEDAIVKRIPLDSVMTIIQQQSLWEPVYHVLAHLSSRLFAHCIRMSQPSAYDTIRFLLVELSLEPLALRNSESVVNYIHNRSFLSRSGISAVLSSLKQGSYIEISQGRLVAIHSLPSVF